ncbi:hypothetical protein M408DRAFT_22856 [Serendipita vermifera MAFF 305830]|uniref:C2H2-type domain-containing protein n=1 Tax=Serendipita vermifera MAFF 305830 TaxID=933852 RepID=A0A0C3BBM4_SERVB|nr:hypothetical protein M408DRAFT_22856 [Serendipita vermifera MAFF 305830]
MADPQWSSGGTYMHGVSPLQLAFVPTKDDDAPLSDPPLEYAGASDFEEEGHTPSPTSSDSNMTLALASDNEAIRNALQDIVSDPKYRVQELSKEQCEALSITSRELGYTCPFLQGTGPCQKNERRVDRFKFHLHDHMGMKPYACPNPGSPVPCLRTFHSKTALDRHVESKIPVTCECGLKLLKKNMARHRRKCNGIPS